MSNPLHTIDQKIIETTQEAYLWAYDRLGVYLATVSFAVIAASVMCSTMSFGTRIFDFLFLGYAGLTSAARHYQQGAGRITEINVGQLECRNSRVIRPLYMALFVSVTIVASIKLDGWMVASALLSLLWMYLFCVLIRDREPKDFFEQRKLAGSEA